MLVNRTRFAAPTSDPADVSSTAASGGKAGGALATVVVRVSLAIAQFLSLLMLARVVSVATFGTVTFLLMSARLVAVVSARGRGPQIVQRFAAAEPPGPGSLRFEMARSARGSLLPAAGIAVLAWLLFASEEASLGAVAVATAFFIGAVGFSSAYPALEALKGLGRARLSFVLEILPTVLSVTVAYAVVGSTTWQLPVTVGLVAIGLVAPVVVVLLRLDGSTTSRAMSSSALDTKLDGYLFGSTIISLAVPVSVQAFAALLGSAADAGEVGAALRLMSPAMIVIAGLTGHELASVSRSLLERDNHGVERAIRMTRLVASVLVVPYCVLFLAFPGIATTILGPAYGDIHMVVRLVAIAQIINAVTGIVVETTQLLPGGARLDVRTVSGVTALSLVVAVGLWGLGDRPAAESAAIVFAAVIAVRSISAARFVRRQLQIESKDGARATN